MENLKSVSVFKNGKELKSFKCDRAEITGRSVCFHGVPDKSGGEISLFYTGGIYYDVNHAEKTAIVKPQNEPDIEIIVIW